MINTKSRAMNLISRKQGRREGLSLTALGVLGILNRGSQAKMSEPEMQPNSNYLGNNTVLPPLHSPQRLYPLSS